MAFTSNDPVIFLEYAIDTAKATHGVLGERKGPWQIWLRRLGTDGSQTHRWRKMDSNLWFRI